MLFKEVIEEYNVTIEAFRNILIHVSFSITKYFFSKFYFLVFNFYKCIVWLRKKLKYEDMDYVFPTIVINN